MHRGADGLLVGHRGVPDLPADRSEEDERDQGVASTTIPIEVSANERKSARGGSKGPVRLMGRRDGAETTRLIAQSALTAL